MKTKDIKSTEKKTSSLDKVKRLRRKLLQMQMHLQIVFLIKQLLRKNNRKLGKLEKKSLKQKPLKSVKRQL